MRRSLLFSCALHGVVVLVVLATRPRPMPREAVGAAEVAFEVVPPPIPVVANDVDQPAGTGGGGPSHPSKPAVANPARAHRQRLRALPAIVAAPSPIPEPAPGLAPPPATDDGLVEVPPVGPATEPAGTPDDQAAGAGVGAGAGNGLGDGLGDGFGPGAGGTAMSRELHARVLGNEEVEVRPREGSPIISHDEATALRTRDSFPRLPESVWPEWRPYIVKLELCVGEDGLVREAALRSSASARLDPVVLAAAKTWQYRPRVVDGRPASFCHGVVIKYERW
jgi:hypothetical protein